MMEFVTSGKTLSILFFPPNLTFFFLEFVDTLVFVNGKGVKKVNITNFVTITLFAESLILAQDN